MAKQKKTKKQKDFESPLVSEALSKTSGSQEVSEVLEKTSEEESEEETSELEEEIKDEAAESSVNDNQFHEFLQPSTESFSPVLKKVEVPQQTIDLEQDVAGVLTSTEKRDDDSTRYAPSTRYTENYTEPERNTETHMRESRRTTEDFSVMQPAQINLETAGRDLHPQLRDVAPVNLEPLESRRDERNLEGKYTQPEKINIEKAGREKERVKEYKIK